MAVKFFGQFLVEKGAVSREDLLKAIDLQESKNLKFGEMALSMKLVTEADVERVHQAQRTEDLKFGDMAIKLGILTTDQMNQVLTAQKNSHLYVGEALVQVGGLSQEELPGLLEAFKADQAEYLTDHVTIPQGIPHPDLCEISTDLTYKMLTRVAEIPFRPGQCVVTDGVTKNDVTASIAFSGHADFRYILSVSAPTRDAIARAILKEESVENESREMLEDTVMEFINIVAGNVVAKAAQIGKPLEIHPPEILSDGCGIDIPAGEIGLIFPIYLADNDHAELTLCLKTA